MSTLKVDAIKHNSATTDALVLSNDGSVAIGTCTAKLTSVGGSGLSHRNIVTNGAMVVAQRGTSSTSTGIKTVDRFGLSTSGVDEAMTQAQVDVASGTTPYSLGFRKAYKITNGNQTGGAGTSDRCIVYTTIESQDNANAGWNYTSSSSFTTLSFWAKSSVAQTFYLALTTQDGTQQRYGAPITFSSANTWTKFTYKIPGASGIQFDNNNERGLQIYWTLFRGTGTTDNSFTINQWAAYNSSIRYPDITSTWFTTNDATFELTGVQLETGDTATAYEFRNYGEELIRCMRYYEHSYNDGIAPGANSNVGGWYQNQTSDAAGNAAFSIEYKVRKRAAPVTTAFYADNGTANQWDYARNGSSGKATVTYHRNSQTHLNAYLNVGSGWVICFIYGHWTAESEI